MPERAMSAVPLYDSFDDYDRFVNWERRLASELPFIETQLQAVGARHVLDVACGTGRHALALAQRGYQVVGADLSAGMIERARKNARALATAVSPANAGEAAFVVAGFGELARADGALIGRTDAILCLGSSLPHVLTEADLQAAVDDWHAVLRLGGLVLVQNRNMDMVLSKRERWMPVQQRTADGREWLFVRFYDFDEGGLTFNVVTLERSVGEPWVQRVDATRLTPWRREQLVAALDRAGFVEIECYGDLAGGAFDEASSGNLVLVARRG
jgi:SAM-dependent methyltransferase